MLDKNRYNRILHKRLRRWQQRHPRNFIQTNLRTLPKHSKVSLRKHIFRLELLNARLQDEITESGYLRDCLKQYRLCLDNTRDIILILSNEGIILDSNTAAQNAYYYSREQISGKNIADVTGTQDELLALENLKRNKDNGLLIFFTTHHRAGATFPVEVMVMATEWNKKQSFIVVARDISEQRHIETQLNHLAKHDYLTKIPNRYYLEEYLKQTITRACPTRESALLFIDLDNFKVINDSFGHHTGDQILISLVSTLRDSLRQDDFLARLGGDEFAMVLKNVSQDQAKTLAMHLLQELRRIDFFLEKDMSFNLTVSIGIAMIDGTLDHEKLFAYADVALQNAKEYGKNRIVCIETTEEKARLSEMNSIIMLIKNALKQDKFTLFFQPVYKIGQGIIYHEALLRLIADNGEIILPQTFIPVAERFGLMSLIDRRVFSAALDILMKRDDMNIFINISASSLNDEELLGFIEQNIIASKIVPARIGFEITEIATITDLRRAERWIYTLKNLGCKFALDDFGAGFSSFTRLQRLPVDFLKIDGSFIRNLDNDPTQVALVQAMNAVAHNLGKSTIAEFVESENIHKLLQELKVDCGQGFFLGKPEPLKPEQENEPD